MVQIIFEAPLSTYSTFCRKKKEQVRKLFLISYVIIFLFMFSLWEKTDDLFLISVAIMKITRVGLKLPHQMNDGAKYPHPWGNFAPLQKKSKFD